MHLIIVFDKLKKEITIIEIDITSQDNLMTVEAEKSRKYDLLANKLGNIYKCKTRIIPYVMICDGLSTKYHKKYICSLGISVSTEAYIQSRVLKKTLKVFPLIIVEDAKKEEMESKTWRKF